MRLSALRPARVLDDVDGPRLFTVLSDDGDPFLAYLCDEDGEVERFLLVPTAERIVASIERNELSLRDAMMQQARMFMVDLHRDGTLSAPVCVDPSLLPESVLPTPGAYLLPLANTLLRVRLIGSQLAPHRVPASVVRRAVDGATSAVRALIRHVLDVRPATGRPTDQFRRFYDLPATEFAFRSFEVSFGMPAEPAQLDITDDQNVLGEVSRLLSAGLEWAAATDDSEAPTTREWRAIIEALSHLTPPQKGVVESVAVSGTLARRARQPIVLEREAAERVGYVRRKMNAASPMEVTFEGLVREFDKDALTFWLRNSDGTNLAHVSFTEDQYDDALLAFDSERVVTVFAYRPDAAKMSIELISIAFKGEAPPVSDATD